MRTRAHRRSVRLLLALALLPLPAFAQTHDIRADYGTRSLDAAKLIKAAEDLQQAGKLKDARAALDSAQKLDPQCDFIYYFQGSIFTDMGDMDLGVAAYEKAFNLGKNKPSNITIDAAVNLGIYYGQLHRNDDSTRWFSLAIVTDPDNTKGLLPKAYRNLAISLVEQKKFADAALAAIAGRRLAPEKVEAGLVRECIKQAELAADMETFRCLFLQPVEADPKPRSPTPDLKRLTPAGDAIDQTIDQLLPDPQGRWTLAVTAGQKAYFLLLTTPAGVRASRIAAPATISSACLANGHFYVATRDPAGLQELDPATGKSLHSWNLPAIAPSIAVFPTSGMAFFPSKGLVWSLNLKSGIAASTGKEGQTVAGHPNERYLLVRVKDENDVGHSDVFEVDGHTVVIDSSPADMMPTTLIEYYVAGDKLLIAAARDNASSNGYDVALSPDGKYAALPGGGGWRSESAQSQKLAGYTIPVYSTADLHLQAAFNTDAFPKGLAINPVTGQVAAVREADARLYHLAASATSTQTLPGPFHGAVAWSGDGRYLLLAADRGVVAYANTLNKDEVLLAATWYKKIGPDPAAVAVAPAARAAALPALRTFRPLAALPEIRQAFADARQKGSSIRPAPWADLPAYTTDKSLVSDLTDIVHEPLTSDNAGPHIYRLRQLAKAHPDSIPVKFFLADASSLADQADEARPLLLDVIHTDAGQTELTLHALDALAHCLAHDKQLLPAASCLVTAYGLDHGDAGTRRLAEAIFPAAGLNDALDALHADQPAGAASTVGKPLPALQPLAPAAPALATTALYQKASHAVVAITCGDSAGTGFCAGDPTTIVTSLHVVADDVAIDVTPFVTKDGKLQRGTPVKAQVVAKSKEQDLAILRIAAPETPLVPLPVAAIDPPPGEKIYAVGNPGLADQSLDLTMSDGIVSAAPRNLDDQTLLQHTAGVNPGNSGGPLLNARGEVVGVVCLDARLKSVAFATPVSIIRKLFTAKP